MIFRNVTQSRSQIEDSLTSVKETGFLNYYGLQRFGTSSIPTFHIGRALLQGRWEEVGHIEASLLSLNFILCQYNGGGAK